MSRHLHHYILVREVAERLVQPHDMLCGLDVTTEHDGGVTVTITVPPSLGATELAQELTYLAGLGNVRAFAHQYGIAPEKIEALLPKG